jgi:hypothetical protein
MNEQNCPICNASIRANPRYPKYICKSCVAKASSIDGRLLAFSNLHIFGGFDAVYTDTGEKYLSHDCYISGVKCYAEEAYFGGIVIEQTT